MLRKTTIQIDEVNQRWLDSLKAPGEAYNDVLDRFRGIADPRSALDALRDKMVEEAEQKAKEIYLQKLRDYREAHQGEADAARKALGIDLKPGQKAPALDEGKWKKRE